MRKPCLSLSCFIIINFSVWTLFVFLKGCNLLHTFFAGGGLSVVSHGSAYPHPPIVPPTFFNGAFTCQPYHGFYVNHIYFQLANAFFLLSHLAPSGIHGVLYLRSTLLVGCAFLALWGWTIACWLDAALWNALFVAINFVHVCMLLYRLRPMKFTREIEEVIFTQPRFHDGSNLDHSFKFVSPLAGIRRCISTVASIATSI